MIKIFSDSAEITSLLDQLKAINVSFTLPGKNFNPNEDLADNEYYLFQVSDPKSDLFRSIISISPEYSNNCFFTLIENKDLLNKLLTKIGFQNVFDYPEYKIKLELSLIESGLQENKKNKNNKERVGRSFKNIIGNSLSIKKARVLAEKAALNPDINVLLIGETGTGKRLFAQSIHKAVKGNKQPFVDVICNSYSENLLETELLGYEKNAFEGAHFRKSGLFELAENGTIYFDGIGNLSTNLQAHLLNILEKKTVRRISGVQEIPIKVRIISSSVKNLHEFNLSSKFNQDLLLRLNTITIELHPLRERKEDIVLLTQSFINDICKRYNKKAVIIDEKLKTELINYSWPGNIRELRNSVERALMLTQSEFLTTEHFEFAKITPDSNVVNKNNTLPENIINLGVNYKITSLESLAELYAREVLSKMNGSKIKTSHLLKISRPKLDKLLKVNSKKK